MPRPKGSQNKITTEFKEQLQSLIDEVVNSIEVNLMDTNQKQFDWLNHNHQGLLTSFLNKYIDQNLTLLIPSL